jgi:hypothetical protein
VRHLVLVIAVIWIALGAPEALAFFDPPWITPASPKAGEPVSVNTSGGICDVFVEWPGYPRITRNGDAARIINYGNHETFDDFCIYGLWETSEPVGSFAPGDYTLTADFAYEDPLSGPTTTTLGVLSFTVPEANAAPVPTLDRLFVIALSLLVSILGLIALPVSCRSRALRLPFRRIAPPAIALMLVAPSAKAFFDPPWLTPVSPKAGEVVSVNIRDGSCDAIFFKSGYPQITVQGNAIHLLEYGHHWDTEDLCVYETGHLAEPIGAYPPGAYTVTVDFTYEDAHYCPSIITLGVVSFSVTGAPAASPVPAIGRLGVIILSLLVSIFGSRALPTRQSTTSSLRAHAIVLSAISLMLVAPPAKAFFDSPWITPMEPRPEDTVYVNIRGGMCDSIFEHPGYPVITQQGNAIHVVEYGHHWDTTDLCIYPVGTLTAPIGAYPNGSYTVTVDFVYDDFLFGPTILGLGTALFNVAEPTTAASVPTLDRYGLLALLLIAPGIALPMLRYRRLPDRR